MFNELNELEDLVENLEVRFLANRGPNIHFALLTDFKDAKEEIRKVMGNRMILISCYFSLQR